MLHVLRGIKGDLINLRLEYIILEKITDLA